MKKRKLAAFILAGALILGAAGGIGAAVRYTTGSRVLVVPVTDLNYGGGSDMGEMQGMVTSDASQKAYVDQTQTVKELLVKKGQTVHAGDVLYRLDTRKSSLDLEMLKVNKEQIQLQIRVAQENSRTLSQIRPWSDGGSDDPGDDNGGGSDVPEPDIDPDQPETELPEIEQPETEKPETDQPETKQPETEQRDRNGKAQYGAGKLFDTLDGGAADQYYTDALQKEPAGSESNPRCYLCREGTKITADFIQALREKDASGISYISLQIREGNKTDGELICSWTQALSVFDISDPVAWPMVVRVSRQGEKQPESETEEPQSEQPQTESNKPEIESNQPEIENGQPETESVKAGIRRQEKSGAYILSVVPVNMNLYTASAGTDQEDGKFSNTEGGSGSTDGGTSTGLISRDAHYSSQELAQARREQADRLRDLQLDLREANLKIRAAETASGDGTVRASMDGIVRKAGDPENPSADGGPFVEVSASGGLFIRSGLSERLLDQVRPGTKVTVNSWMSGASYPGVIRDISDFPDQSGYYASGSDSRASYYPITVQVEGGSSDLHDGDWVGISLNPAADEANAEESEEGQQQSQIPEEGESGETAEGAEDAAGEGSSGSLYLMKAFVLEENGKNYVYIRDEKERLKKQEVTARTGAESCQILSGLSETDYIAFPYGKNVKDGARTREGTVDELYSY